VGEVDGKVIMARILVVDNSEKTTKWFKTIFSRNHTILTASDGIEAIQKTLAETPDVVFLDTEMPRMNGYQACQIIKQNPSASKIPIIFLCDKPKEIEKHLTDKLGAFDCISRPFDEKTISDAIKKALESIRLEPLLKDPELDQLHPNLTQFKQKHCFSDALMNFIKDYINSEHKLNILIFFYENRRSHFSCWDISERFHLDMFQVRKVLDDFVRDKIVDRTPLDINKYHYKPETYLVIDVEELYREYNHSGEKQMALKKISNFHSKEFT